MMRYYNSSLFSAEYLSILNELNSLFGMNGPIVTVLRYDMQLNGNYKPILRRVRKSLDNRIVVVGSTETMPEFLNQVKRDFPCPTHDFDNSITSVGPASWDHKRGL